jgi:PAS domain S-box-containing protein
LENNGLSNQFDYSKLLEESAEDLYEQAVCGYLTTLPDGLIVKINRTLLQWLGYEPHEIIHQRKFSDFLSIGGKIFYETRHVPVLAMQGWIQEISYDLISRDRRMVPVLVNAKGVTDARGVTQLHRITIFNITERRNYEQELLLAKRKAEEKSRELAASEDKLRQSLNQTIELGKLVAERELLLDTLANASPAALWMSDTRGDIVYINRTWTEWTGQPQEAHLAQRWSTSILEEDRQPTLETYWASFQAQSYFRADLRIYHRDGQLHWCLAEGVPRYEASGAFAGYVGSCTDITERKRSEQQLQRMNQQLEAASQELLSANKKIKASHAQLQSGYQELMAVNQRLAKANADLDNFVYTASHDLKSPIANIEGLINVLITQLRKKGWLDSFTLSLTDMIHSSIARFKETILDLTEVARIQKQGDLLPESVELDEVVKHVMLDLQKEIRDTRAQIELHLGSHPKMMFQRKNLKSVVYNLLSNALKYRSSERTAHIQLTFQPEGAYQVLSVADNGLGIPPGDESKVFQMFKRLHSHVEGTGIGLYIVKQIVENAGGIIQVESTLDQGTTFRVFFPQLEPLSTERNEKVSKD